MKKENKKILLTIIIVLGIVGLISLVTSTNDADKELEPKVNETESVQMKTNEQRKMDFDNEELKAEYVKGCIQAGGNQDYCVCTYNEIKEQMEFDEFMTMVIEYNETGEFSEEMITAVERCIKHFQ